MAPRNTPCGWTADLTYCTASACCEGSDDFTPELAALASDIATMTLWALTGRRFGCCPITVRPCKPQGACGDTVPLPELIYYFDRAGRGLDNLGVTFGFVPLLEDGAVFNIACGCKGRCTCKADCEVFLPGPVCSVTEVVIEGVTINPANYKMYDGNKLVFLAGQACPPCQDYNQPLGQPGTWSVAYNIGKPLPPGAELMAGLYACEIARALSQDASCKLPGRVRHVARQGIDIEEFDPFTIIDAGLIGLPVVDNWIRTLNPARLAQPSRVWSPDIPIVRRET